MRDEIWDEGLGAPGLTLLHACGFPPVIELRPSIHVEPSHLLKASRFLVFNLIRLFLFLLKIICFIYVLHVLNFKFILNVCQ